MNLFLTEDGVVKLGYYGLTTQTECYSIKKTDCDGFRSFAPEVVRGDYGMYSDVWSLGITLIELIGMTPYSEYDNYQVLTLNRIVVLPFDNHDIETEELIDFLENCFIVKVPKRWSVSELLDVSGMGWRMTSSIHL